MFIKARRWRRGHESVPGEAPLAPSRRPLGRARLPGPTAWGQALVEFALTLTVLLFLLVGVVDFARVFYYDIVVSSAANEGARAAADGASNANVEAAIRTSAGALGASLIFTATTDVTPNEAGRTNDLIVPLWTTVTVHFTFSPLTPLASSLVGSSIALDRGVSQRMRSSCCY